MLATILPKKKKNKRVDVEVGGPYLGRTHHPLTPGLLFLHQLNVARADGTSTVREAERDGPETRRGRRCRQTHCLLVSM